MVDTKLLAETGSGKMLLKVTIYCHAICVGKHLLAKKKQNFHVFTSHTGEKAENIIKFMSYINTESNKLYEIWHVNS